MNDGLGPNACAVFNSNENTPLEITTDGDVLMLRPVRGDKKGRVRASAAKMVKAHAKTLAKLAT
jgi:hypothetical protein